jgi:RND superfamily putative drug exporter
VEALARLVIRRRWLVIGVWVGLVFAGLAATGKLSDRWFESFSIPGYSGYEANQRILETFGTGAQAPVVVVLSDPDRDITTVPGVEQAIAAANGAVDEPTRVGSWFETRNDMYLSDDRHTMVATIYPPGEAAFGSFPPIEEMRAALEQATPAGVESHLTGRDAVYESQGGESGPGVLAETLLGGLGALIVLLFVFGTLPAVLMPLIMAAASILTTFLCVLGVTYITDVSIIVQFLIALVGLGVAIDYALLMIFRFREELSHGETTDEALAQTMSHAGRSVIVSGTTVAIGLLSMLILPLPFIRSIGLGGMLIPLVSVLASLTLLPAMLSLFGSRINSLRVMPKRFVAIPDPDAGFWGRWARIVLHRPLLVFAAGAAIVVIVLIPAFQMHPSDAELSKQPAVGDAEAGRAAITAAGIPAGVYLPHIVLVENGSAGVTSAVAGSVATAPGIHGAAAPPAWQQGGTGLVEAFGDDDANSRAAKTVIADLRESTLPQLEQAADADVVVTLAGEGAVARDFIDAVYGNFPYVLLFVLVLSYILLARAFRSLLLPLKAVILNLVSLGAAYGIVVFIFQQGHGSELIWDIEATDAIISWIPVMIFAFLYGISMDYEVFMLTRMREAYDDTRDTKQAIQLGLARTGKLVTSAALVLMFAFFSLSTGPGPDIKQFAIGLAAGIIFDATVIRGLLVPSTMVLLGRWNWWLPAWAARLLRTKPSPLAPRDGVAHPEPTES